MSAVSDVEVDTREGGRPAVDAICSAAERAAYKLRRQAEKKTTQEVALNTRMGADRTQFFADAQLFSFRTFQNDARRNQFLDYVRAEMER